MDNTVGSQQYNIIVGTLLGDGCLERNGRRVRLVVGHSVRQKMYLDWKAECLLSLQPSISDLNRFDRRTGKTYEFYLMRTRSLPDLEQYVRMFYGSGRRKHVPEELPQVLNPQMLAVWIMDDGYRRNDCNALRLNTQGYTFTEQQIIQRALATLLITSNIQKHKHQFVVYIPSGSMSRLRTLVQPFLIPSMAYKLA